ncbi:MAG: hypothetical protein LBS11_08590 [Oscillospiraceae bacterium]|jgi:hypothetical protein|nr:hypothetical protein [Oscillospiraceae bacterium]
MSISANDRAALRELAKRVAEAAASPVNAKRVQRSKDTHSLKPVRPLVWLDEIPWHEMDFDGLLTPRCEDEEARAIEIGFRRLLMRWDYFQADMVVSPYFYVDKAYTDSGIGLDVSEDVLAVDRSNNIVSHRYVDQLDTPEKVDALEIPVLTADPALDERRVDQAESLFGDILPVRLRGHLIYYAPWDTIGRLRGVENCLIDMAERPEFIHRIVAKFTEIGTARINQMVQLDLLGLELSSLHCTPPYTNELPAPDWDGGRVRLKDVWFRGMAQLFAAASPAMHEEFDIAYMRPLMERCGLSYYGCCEPLDRVIPYLKKVSNLRKIGVSPWANARSSAEQIGGDYVFARKPNPALVAGTLDPGAVRADIMETVEACQANGCPYEFVLKDISTVGYKPGNLVEWVRVVERTLDEYYPED